ncbi:MAG: DUF4258 domain-containing protein [Dehalococcoidia bacterium]|jgi:hypothetical protein
MNSSNLSGAVVSVHAVSEIRRRALPVEEVARALAEPDQVVSVRPGRVVLHRKYSSGGREYLLRVFVDVDPKPPVVVTLYRTSKIQKYWSTA